MILKIWALIHAFFILFIGLALAVGALSLILWNEYHALEGTGTLSELSSQVLNVQGYNPENEGKIIYINGTISTSNIVQDQLFDVSKNTIKFERIVETYQWTHEERRKTTSTPIKSKREVTRWKQGVGPSLSNIMENPERPLYESQYTQNGQAIINGFVLSQELVDKLNTQIIEDFPEQIQTEQHTFLKRSDNYYYLSENAIPEVGDTRVSFWQVKDGQLVSIIAQQSGDNLQAYITAENTSFAFIEQSEKSVQEMIKSEQRQIHVIKIFLRIVGVLLFWGGVRLMALFPASISAFLPLIDDFLIKVIHITANMITAIILLIVFAIAWKETTPGLSNILYILIIPVVIYSIIKMGKRK